MLPTKGELSEKNEIDVVYSKQIAHAWNAILRAKLLSSKINYAARIDAQKFELTSVKHSETDKYIGSQVSLSTRK